MLLTLYLGRALDVTKNKIGCVGPTWFDTWQSLRFLHSEPYTSFAEKSGLHGFNVGRYWL